MNALRGSCTSFQEVHRRILQKYKCTQGLPIILLSIVSALIKYVAHNLHTIGRRYSNLPDSMFTLLVLGMTDFIPAFTRGKSGLGSAAVFIEVKCSQE